MSDADVLRKVRTGGWLRIPARAYNAFSDAAQAPRQREQDQQRQA